MFDKIKSMKTLYKRRCYIMTAQYNDIYVTMRNATSGDTVSIDVNDYQNPIDTSFTSPSIQIYNTAFGSWSGTGITLSFQVNNDYKLKRDYNAQNILVFENFTSTARLRSFRYKVNNNGNLSDEKMIYISIYKDIEDLTSVDAPAASTTNFTTSTGADLNAIFQPISLGTTIGYNTGFQVSGNDLKNIFAARTSAAGSATGFEVSGNDLNTIFEPINLTKKLIVDTATSGSAVFPVLSGEKMTVILVGGGGGGSTRTRNAPFSAFSAGNGGAGGEIKIEEITTAGSYSISYSIGAGGTGSTTSNSAGNDGDGCTVTIGGTTYTASGGAGGNVGLDGIGSQGTAGDYYNYNHGGTAAVKYVSSGDTYIDATEGQGGFVLTVDGTAYKVGGGGGGGKTWYDDNNDDRTLGGIGGGDGGRNTEGGAGENGGGGGGGPATLIEKIDGGDGGDGFLCIVVHS